MSVIEHCILRGAIAEPLARPVVELAGNRIAVVLRQVFHALALGQLLPDQAVRVFCGGPGLLDKLAA